MSEKGKREDNPMLLCPDAKIPYSPTLAARFGDNAALLLQQIHFCIESAKESGNTFKYREGHWWVYNTLKDWKEGSVPGTPNAL